MSQKASDAGTGFEGRQLVQCSRLLKLGTWTQDESYWFSLFLWFEVGGR